MRTTFAHDPNSRPQYVGDGQVSGRDRPLAWRHKEHCLIPRSESARARPTFSPPVRLEGRSGLSDAGHSVDACVAHFGFSKQTWHAAKNRGEVVTRPHAMPINVLLSGPRDRAHLKKRLLKAGLLADRCDRCDLADCLANLCRWSSTTSTATDKTTRLENLALLCPNCHSQTDSWGAATADAALVYGARRRSQLTL